MPAAGRLTMETTGRDATGFWRSPPPLSLPSARIPSFSASVNWNTLARPLPAAGLGMPVEIFPAQYLTVRPPPLETENRPPRSARVVRIGRRFSDPTTL